MGFDPLKKGLRGWICEIQECRLARLVRGKGEIRDKMKELEQKATNICTDTY